MLKLLLILAVLGAVLYFLRNLLIAFVISSIVVFVFLFFVGLVFLWQGINEKDLSNLLIGLALSLFSALYLILVYIEIRQKKKA